MGPSIGGGISLSRDADVDNEHEHRFEYGLDNAQTHMDIREREYGFALLKPLTTNNLGRKIQE